MNFRVAEARLREYGSRAFLERKVVHFEHSQILWLTALVVPLLGLFLGWAWRRRRERVTRFIHANLVEQLTLGLSVARRKAKLALLQILAIQPSYQPDPVQDPPAYRSLVQVVEAQLAAQEAEANERVVSPLPPKPVADPEPVPAEPDDQRPPPPGGSRFVVPRLLDAQPGRASSGAGADAVERRSRTGSP